MSAEGWVDGITPEVLRGMATPLTRSRVRPRRAQSATSVDGAALLDDVHAFVLRFVAFPEPAQASAVTLWIAHTHAFDAAHATPRLSIQSKEKRSGKTRLLEVLDLLVNAPVPTASISAAAMFRLIANEPVTLLIDEVDTVFSRAGNGNEGLRGVLNAGYRRGGTVIRTVAGSVERFPVFAPVALAGIGELPDTVQDRSIVIRLRRRDEEPIERLRHREVEADCFTLHAGLGKWARENSGTLASMHPDVPPSLGDRAADIWEPLLAIASCAGSVWPARAASAAQTLSGHP